MDFTDIKLGPASFIYLCRMKARWTDGNTGTLHIKHKQKTYIYTVTREADSWRQTDRWTDKQLGRHKHTHVYRVRDR